MPRNVSRSPHELVTYTLRFIFTLRACSKGRADSGRSYRVKSEFNLKSQRAAEKSAALFAFWELLRSKIPDLVLLFGGLKQSSVKVCGVLSRNSRLFGPQAGILAFPGIESFTMNSAIPKLALFRPG